MTLQDVLEKDLGVKTRGDEIATNTTLQTTATQVCPNDPSRLALTIINTGSNNAFIYVDNSVSTTKGIFIAANGGTLSLNFRDDLGLCALSFFGVGSGGTTTITFLSQRAFN